MGGGWKGSGEERDNKAGGDVNSQIGSFSCFPQPATLDGWLRQRPERIGETRAPPESWGWGADGGEGVAGAWLGSAGRELPEGGGERNGPREAGGSPGKRRRIAQTVRKPPLSATSGPGDSTGSRRVRVCVPSG